MNSQVQPHRVRADSAVPRATPRIALLGEFSAGKSTLANVLLGQNVSPVQVTATQMPPIWYSHGQPACTGIRADGSEVAIPGANLTSEVLDGVRAVKVSMETEVLQFCDLIDMPGTSDPNLSMPTWEAMLSVIDGVIWCTPASQAWRQSEAALWEEVGGDLADSSMLLVTRMDKIAEAGNRERILDRVRRETAGNFSNILGISLTEALRAGRDDALLEACGGHAVAQGLMEMIHCAERRAPLRASGTGVSQ
ncbi:dynamin family protein [Vannielia sp. SX4]|uniref:dynamin family protein n=1 Tax=Vannielia sp. SX4 TaxID=3463852 RepID=UPI004058607E